MRKVAIAIINTNAKLTKKPIRTAFSRKVPLTAAIINKIPKEDLILSHRFPFNTLKEEQRINAQLYNNNIPAAVVIYSKIFPGNKRAAKTDANRPTPPRMKDGNGN